MNDLNEFTCGKQNVSAPSTLVEGGYVSPVQVARSLGLSESTVKRWVDENRLPAHRTVGGHRKILVRDVLDFVTREGLPRVDLAILGVESKRPTVDVCELRKDLYASVVSGKREEVHGLILHAHLHGLSLPILADEVISPVMVRIGHGWSSGEVDVYEEHRGTHLILSGLLALQSRLEATEPSSEGKPIAVGGGPEGDHYILANLLVEMSLRQMGWRVINIGPNTPFDSFRKAIVNLRPQLLWLSCSYLPDPERFVSGYEKLYQTAESSGIAVAVGGRALTEEIRCRMTFTHHGDRLSHLAAYARQIQQRLPLSS